MPSTPTGWFADIDPDHADTEYRWQPVLQVPGMCQSFDVWFESEAECLQWIDENVIGAGRLPD